MKFIFLRPVRDEADTIEQALDHALEMGPCHLRVQEGGVDE
jgi:hypothetical protein